MKLMNVSDPEKLMKVIDSCKGTVELISPEGDRLNLKSKLCQLISLTSIFNTQNVIKELELVAYEPEDIQKLVAFMVDQ